MRHLSIDIETASGADIGSVGLYRYAQDREFRILLFAYKVDDDDVKIIDLAMGEKIPDRIVDALMDPMVTKHAFNAAFEWYCLNTAGYKTDLLQWRCTMIHSLYLGYPGSLDASGKAVGLPQDKQKLATGKALIRFFCVPRKPTKKDLSRWNLPEKFPEKWAQFKEYCLQDVVTENALLMRFNSFPVPEREWHLWRMDVRMNAFGVRVDAPMVKGALKVIDLSNEELTAEAVMLTGLENPNSNAQILRWLNEREVGAGSVAKEAVADMLASDIPDDVRRVLELKSILGKSSVKKYATMYEAMGRDHRIRGISQFYGANRTGRWAGRLVQMQNLTKNHIETIDEARALITAADYEGLKKEYGDPIDILSQMIRPAFIPSGGRHFVVADFSAIEARVIAWLAGEEWRLDLFRKGGDIYCESASKMFHVPVEKNGVNGHMRQKGKVAELALGYQGAVNALITMGALKMGLTEDELPEIVELWRQASPNIVRLWYSVEKAMIRVLETAEPVTVQGITYRLESELTYGQTFLTAELPAGRKLYYPKPFLKENRFGKKAVHFWSKEQGAAAWGINSTYGGCAVENLIQGIARDCLAEILLRIEARGWQAVFHVHDEVIVDAPMDVDVDQLCDIMAEPIPWAPDLPLKGAGFNSMYYMKD